MSTNNTPTELYKKYRPTSLDQVVENDGIKAELNAMIDAGKVPHAILFHGPSGCAKTTIARILRVELGCADADFREINSAAFRGIDSIRDIQRNMNAAPIAGPKRVYLIDEVHKLTNDAQNAALKMLEDTPRHVHFFLATTEEDKLIKAVRTRCHPIPVSAVTDAGMSTLLNRVIKKEKLTVDATAVAEVVRNALGSPRMGLVLLEKIAALPPAMQLAAVTQAAEKENEAIELCRAVMARKEWGTVAAILKNLKGEPESVRRAVLGYARACLVGAKTSKAGWQAYNVIISFKDNLFDSGAAGLAASAFEAVSREE